MSTLDGLSKYDPKPSPSEETRSPAGLPSDMIEILCAQHLEQFALCRRARVIDNSTRDVLGV